MSQSETSSPQSLPWISEVYTLDVYETDLSIQKCPSILSFCHGEVDHNSTTARVGQKQAVTGVWCTRNVLKDDSLNQLINWFHNYLGLHLYLIPPSRTTLSCVVKNNKSGNVMCHFKQDNQTKGCVVSGRLKKCHMKIIQNDRMISTLAVDHKHPQGCQRSRNECDTQAIDCHHRCPHCIPPICPVAWFTQV